MQVTETLSEGLKRAFKVVLPVDDLAKRLDDQLVDMKDKVRINGFRPGKVPVAHLKKVYGKQVMADVLQNALNEVNRKIVDDNGIRLAGEPKIDIDGGEQGVQNAIEAKGDLAFTVNLEVLPKFEVGTFDDVALERLVVQPTDEEVNDALNRMAEQNRPFTAKEGAAAKGDKVIIDFVGKIDGEAFPGGAGTDTPLVLGSGQFIPGFEDQLEGVSKDDTRAVTVKFPDEYQAAHLAGKEAVFDVTVKGVEAPGEVKIDDEYAKGLGLESLDKLKEAIRANIQREFDQISREKLKRGLLDALDKKFAFELPPSLVEQEFNGIWNQVLAEQAQSKKTFADENTTEEAAKADYQRIAERRVRLGLVLAEVGEQSKVEVSNDELSQAIIERARQYPGQEKAIWDYYQKNADAVAQIRAPLYEEKVVDVIVSKAKVTDKSVTKEELLKPIDEDAAKV
ncbi:trigger factor [Roseiarcaceae bacterium H3SJ34-1]|uniref:trigger factor n=1 Tax=Terripilifer ovatus TaxID=3032367 RepID=UPI003AB96ED0|nr:trigger factor [Roseiarcaceae bacterium H3SJ34-1]